MMNTVYIEAHKHELPGARGRGARSSRTTTPLAPQEVPAGLGARQIEELRRIEQSAGRPVKVGFNHRFHPALRDLRAEVSSGRYGELMHLRARYGHVGRPGYDREWRAQPDRSGEAS